MRLLAPTLIGIFAGWWMLSWIDNPDQCWGEQPPHRLPRTVFDECRIGQQVGHDEQRQGQAHRLLGAIDIGQQEDRNHGDAAETRLGQPDAEGGNQGQNQFSGQHRAAIKHHPRLKAQS